MNNRELRAQAKARKIPKYYRMTKPQLLSALGMSAEKKLNQAQSTKRKAIDAHSQHLGEGNATKRALIKGRITRSIERGLVAEEKSQGRKLSQEEKRTVAAKALASEVKAIKSGKPENKPKRGNGQAQKAERSHPKQKESDHALTQKIKKTIAANPDIKLRELQAKVGYKSSAYGNLPDTNPLNHHLKKMVASGDISSKGGGTFEGEPKFNVPQPSKLTPEQHQQVANDVERIKKLDRHGRIGEAMAKGDEKMLRSHAREQMLNHPRTMFNDFKTHEDAIVASYKARSTQPTAKHSIASFKRKPKAEPVEQKIKLEDVKTPSDRAAYAKQEAAHQRSLGNEKAAKAWDEKAKEGRKAAIARDTIAQTQSQTSLFGVTDHASDMPLFGGSDSSPKKPASAPSGLAEVSPHDLNFDPKRFQYKMAHGAETGSSGSLTGVGKWDENLGGVMQVWRDPKDGKDYVVNGHNRATLARKLGAEKVAVRYLAVDTAHEARAIGALTNIAEGRGNSLDSAKFFRDSGITREDLEAKGIPMKEAIATNGLALSKLAPHLFDKVVQGDIPIERATLIGDRIHNHDNQTKLVELIDKAQSKGRKITNDVVRELADTVQSAPSHNETQFSLFGAEETTQNLALEKAELTAHVRGRLSREKKLFGLVSKSKAAKELERGGNSIDTEKSKDISDQASQVLGVFDQLKNQSGPVSAAINKATERIANGEDHKKVKDDLHQQLLTEIPQALGIRKRPGSEGTQSPSEGGTGQKRLKVKKS